MKTLSSKDAAQFMLAIAIVATVAFIARGVNAEENKPTREDYAELKGIDANQGVIALTRQSATTVIQAVENGDYIDVDYVGAYNRFIEAKKDNEKRVATLNSRSWNVNWSTMELVPSF
jgi:hypothetical protein